MKAVISFQKKTAVKPAEDTLLYKEAEMIPFPSLAGTNPNNVRIDGDVKAGNSPGSDSSLCQAFPDFSSGI